VTTGNIKQNDLPAAFGSSDINNYKQKTVTTTTSISGNIDMKDLPNTFGSSDINNFMQKTVTSKSNIVDNNFMKDMPESFGSFNINNFTPTATVTTIKNSPSINYKQFGNAQEASSFKTNIGLGGVSSSTGGFDFKSSDLNAGQGNTVTKTSTSTTKTIGNNNFDIFGLGGSTTNYNISGASSNAFGTSQNQASNYNTYGATTTTSNVQKTFSVPTQSNQSSYSYNYSYQIPATSSTTVTKTTYSGVSPGTNF
jgi:hypothetical protein